MAARRRTTTRACPATASTTPGRRHSPPTTPRSPPPSPEKRCGRALPASMEPSACVCARCGRGYDRSVPSVNDMRLSSDEAARSAASSSRVGRGQAGAPNRDYYGRVGTLSVVDLLTQRPPSTRRFLITLPPSLSLTSTSLVVSSAPAAPAAATPLSTAVRWQAP